MEVHREAMLAMARVRGNRPVNTRLTLLLCCAIVVPILIQTINLRLPWVDKIELQAYDRHMSDLPHIPPDPRLVIVGMDDDSLNHLYENRLIDRPDYTRSMHAKLLRELYKAGARVVAFDVYFTSDAPRD